MLTTRSFRCFTTGAPPPPFFFSSFFCFFLTSSILGRQASKIWKLDSLCYTTPYTRLAYYISEHPTAPMRASLFA